MDKASPTVQLFLPVQTRLEKHYDSYISVSNQSLIECLKKHIQQKDETLIMLVGPESVGKTHLLSSSVHFYETCFNRDPACAYFSLSELSGNELSSAYYDELLNYFESFSFLALDDLDNWLATLTESQRYDAELLIFNLFNHYKMNGKLLMIASKCPPSRLNIDLNDLKSRLASGLLLTVSELNDEGKVELIKSLARLKGFLMDDDVAAFILKRSGRDVVSLLNVIEDLDKATLMEQRRLTVPFVKKIFNW